MSFMIKNDTCLDEYNEVWDKIKTALNSIKISEHACLWWKIHKSQGKRI